MAKRRVRTTRPRGKARKGPAKRARPAKVVRRGDIDKRKMYELAVQGVEHEIDFVTREFKKLTGRDLRFLREDFAASAAAACEFVKRHRGNRAVALDIDKPVLEWGRRHNVGAMNEDQQGRISLLLRNVMTPGREASGVDAVAAMNFSYWVFDTRESLLNYFKIVHRTMKRDGVLFMDAYAGWDADKLLTERRRVYAKGSHFTYVWDQAEFDPFTNRIVCKIHFEFQKGPALRNAFVYHWRLWSLAELFELLKLAGFKKTTLYQEGDDKRGGGNGVFSPTRGKAEHCASQVVYLVAEKNGHTRTESPGNPNGLMIAAADLLDSLSRLLREAGYGDSAGGRGGGSGSGGDQAAG